MNRLSQFATVAVGGMIGAMLRYGAYLLSNAMAPELDKVWVTAGVNVAGSLIMGCLFGASQHWAMDQRLSLLLMIGLLGSFTTFSTFAVESVEILASGRVAGLVLYFLTSNMLSIGAAWFGITIGRSFGP